MRIFQLVLLATLVVTVTFASAEVQSPNAAPTEISADLGPCSADFHVTDMDGKGVYNAKIHTVIRYGFMSKRKLELDAGTNSDGAARFVKLPAETKKPIEFTVSNGADRATRSFDPGTTCHATYDVPLKK